MALDFHCPTAEATLRSIPDGNVTQELADFYKVFGENTRIRLLFALEYSELCVHDLSLILGMQPSAVSHQLKILRQHKVVTKRKEGKKVFYALSDPHIFQLLQVGHSHITHPKEENSCQP